MAQAVEAYRHVSATTEFRELERLRAKTRRNEASALGNARREGELKAKLETARKVLDRGLGVDIAAEITGLTVDEVLRL
jgi:predicted transposase/invertase (TIGR01784 family)